MQRDELDILIDKTATLMVQYERRGAAIDARLQSLVHALERMSQQVPGAVQASATELITPMRTELSNTLRAGLEQPLDGYRQSLRAAGGEADKSARALAGQLDQLQRLHRHLIWKIAGVVAIALALLLGGGAWLSLHYAQVIEANRISAELMQAYNSADVVPCGRRLCAQVDPKAPRYGKRGQYLPIKSR